VLDLNPLVDFEEIKTAMVVHDELDGAGVGIVRGLGDFHGGLADFVAQFANLYSSNGDGASSISFWLRR